MTDPLDPDRASVRSSTTGTSDVFDDARSHIDWEAASAAAATPTVSRPDTPSQLPVVADAEEETPRPLSTSVIKQLEAARTHSGHDADLQHTPTVRRTVVHSSNDDKPSEAVSEKLSTPDGDEKTSAAVSGKLSTNAEDEKTPEAVSGKASTSGEDEKDISVPTSRSGAEHIAPVLGPDHDAPTHPEEHQAEPTGVSGDDARPNKEANDASKEEDVLGASGEDESNYLTGIKLYLLTIGLFFATFVIALDNTIIATAIPKITTEFNSLDDVGWYGSSYLLTTTALQPSFGKIFTYFNVKWTYVLAVIIFEVGSIVCATAPNSTALIVGRAIAGLGAAGLFSGGITIVGYSVPLRRRALYIAILSSTFGIASIVGPILGGIFTDSPVLKWRFCFWINLPVGGIAIVTTSLFFSSPPRKNAHLSALEKLRQMDLPGAFVLICAICCLLLALQWGGTTYPWKDSRVWGTLLGFGLLLIVFIALQLWAGQHATIPLRIISQRGVAIGVVFIMLLSFSLFAHIFYSAFYFQSVKGTTAEGSGIRSIPYLVSNTLASIVVGACITIFGPYTPFLWVGSAVFTVGAGLMHTWKVDSGPGEWIGYQLIAGIGAGASIQVPFIATQAILDPIDLPTGNALTIFFNTLGGALSVSACQNIFTNELAEQLQASVPPFIIEIVNLAGPTGVNSAVPVPYLQAVLQAYDDAVAKTFIVPIVTGTMAFAVSLFMPWGTVKGKNLLTGAA